LPTNGLTGAGAASTLAQVSAIRGREAEIAVRTDALDLVESGRRAVVLIEGEAGIGKTRLQDAALEDARTALPPTLRLTILRRLSFLSDPMLQALRFASILGGPDSPLPTCR
jgi:MoxR-like ATPase